MSDNSRSIAAAPVEPIVARPARYYQNVRYVLSIAFIAYGLYFAYDGWVGYPKRNQEIAQVERDLENATAANDTTAASKLQARRKELGNPHSEADLRLQKILGVLVPLGGLGILIWGLYYSRGQYRLQDNTLHLPGHPLIALDSITAIDQSQWKKKGLARIDYQSPAGAGRATLDDCTYDRLPTDAIVERICIHLGVEYVEAKSPANDASEQAQSPAS